MALFYGIELICPGDFLNLCDAIKPNRFHQEVLSWSIYFAPWIKSEVNMQKRRYKPQDKCILAAINKGRSCSEILTEVAQEVPLESLMLEMRQLNSIDKLIKNKGVHSAKDFHLLDDLEARFVLNFIIQHSDLSDIRLHDA